MLLIFPFLLISIRHTTSFSLRKLYPEPLNHRFLSPLATIPGSGTTAMDKISSLNAELLAKKEGFDLVGVHTGGVQALLSVPKSVMNSKPKVLGQLLMMEGCMSIPKVLSDKTATELLTYINMENQRTKDEVLIDEALFDYRFGGVNCRGLNGIFGQRQDMYLSVSNDIVRKALSECLISLSPLIETTITFDGRLHELSCLVADPGAPRQCMHADTIVLPCPQYPDAKMEPLYTFFVALQDVSKDMGHTVFLPKTHTPEAHILWNVNQKQKEQFIKHQKAVESNLKTGDVAIFDSRSLHCGTENKSNKRRVLFYFTLSKQLDWPLPNGLHGSNSIRIEDRLRWKVKDFL